ncbi:hypothetical protein H0H87_005304 [Tephrocybe sp. NHM501043]|nr:hypothetical protein H0H87_005304 [Tephrocybe sp. NHM501043]
MPSASGHYDQTLLATAPAATKAQLQGGYTTDLLHSNQGNATPPPFSASQADVERGLVHKESSHVAPTRALPFWRTRKGMIIIFVAIIVILAAVIGGAVGGTVGKNNTSNGSSGDGQQPGTVGSGGDGVDSGGSSTPSKQSTVVSSPTATPSTSATRSQSTFLGSTTPTPSTSATLEEAAPSTTSQRGPPQQADILVGNAH